MKYSERLLMILAGTVIGLCVPSVSPAQHSTPESGAPETPKVIRKSGFTFQKSAIKRIDPIYPPNAQAQGVQGVVVVEVTTNEQGEVISAHAISGLPLLRVAAEEAARGWTFTPTRLSGIAVKVIGTLTFNFAISDKPTAGGKEEETSKVDLDVSKYTSAIVSIPADGELYFGKDKVTQAEIPLWLKALFKNRSPDEQIVYVKARSVVKYGTVVSVIDTIREAGFNQVGLVAQKTESETSAKKDEPELKQDHPDSTKKLADRGERDAPLTNDELTMIEIKPGGRILLDAKPVLLAKLAARLNVLFRRRSGRLVFIKAPKNMSYGEVVKVIDVVKGAGAQAIGLQTDYLE
jgi:TonB family protein